MKHEKGKPTVEGRKNKWTNMIQLLENLCTILHYLSDMKYEVNVFFPHWSVKKQDILEKCPGFFFKVLENQPSRLDYMT